MFKLQIFWHDFIITRLLILASFILESQNSIYDDFLGDNSVNEQFIGEPNMESY